MCTKHWLLLPLLLISLILGGCVTVRGTDFNRSAIMNVVPGTTTKSEVLAMVGKPASERTFTVGKDINGRALQDPVVIEEMWLYFQDNEAGPALAGIEPSRSAALMFSRGVLLNYMTRSSFNSDSSNFDEAMVRQLERGRTTEADVVRIFGQPSGRGLYPFSKEIDGSVMHYQTFLFSKETRKGTSKRLTVFLNAARVVTDFDLNINTR